MAIGDKLGRDAAQILSTKFPSNMRAAVVDALADIERDDLVAAISGDAARGAMAEVSPVLERIATFVEGLGQTLDDHEIVIQIRKKVQS